jgi:ABC-type multidrug transport system ATPase subunit
LFKAICGLVKPEAGEIDVAGNIDLVADHVQIPPAMTPKAVFNIYDKYERCDIEKRYLLVRKFSYQEQLNKSIGALSQGNLQKLKIILALCGNGSWLLLDEVFNGLDENAIDILNELLGESNRPMLVIDHSLAFSVPNIQNLLMADQHLCTAT